MNDLYYVVLQNSFKNGIPEEPFGITNTNEKNSIMRPYYKSIGVPFSLSSIMRIMEHENKQGAHKKINIIPLEDNIFKVNVTPDETKDSLQGIILLFNGKEIDQNSMIYSQILDIFKNTMKDTVISQLLKVFSGSSQNFQVSEEKLNQDKQSIINELKCFINIDENIRSNVINQDGSVIIAFNIEGKIHNGTIEGVRINNYKMNNIGKANIEAKILNIIKDEFVKNQTIYDINLKDKDKIDHKIRSVLKEYGISYKEYSILDNQLIIETKNHTKEHESLDIRCNSQLLNSEQLTKVNQACMKTSDPMQTAEEIVKSFGTISGKLVDPSTNNQVISFTPKTIGWQFPINTKEDLVDFKNGDLVVTLLSHLSLIKSIFPFKNTLSSFKVNFLKFDLRLKELFSMIKSKSTEKLKEIIAISPGVKLVSLILENGLSITTSINANIHIIKSVMDLFHKSSKKSIKLIEIINPSIDGTIKAGIYELTAKYTLKDRLFSADISCSDSVNIGDWQFFYKLTLSGDNSIDEFDKTEDTESKSSIVDINKKAAIIIALSTPEYILNSTFKLHDKQNKPSVPFLCDLDQSTAYASLSFMFPHIEIFDSKRLLGEQMMKIIILYGASIASSSTNKLAFGGGIGLGLVFNNELHYIVYISIQHVLGKNGEQEKKLEIDIYQGDSIRLYNAQSANDYNERRVYNHELAFLK